MADETPNSGDVFDLDKITSLVELMKAHDLGEINLKQGGQQIQLKRGGQAQIVQAVAPAAPLSAAHAPPPPLPKEAAPPEDENVVYIKSPMVGTYYSKGNPEADAFVRVGDRVESDTTICIVEAMKVFNEIAAEVSGEIVAVLVENEEPVEYGTPLFKVDTSK